jgi:hypothetical protein
MKFCINPKCEGRTIYEGVSCVNGKYIEYYRCLHCLTLHAIPAKSADEMVSLPNQDTQELPSVREDVQS